MQLLLTPTILKPGKQPKGDKKMSTMHVVVPENKKAQTRKALMVIYPSTPRHNYLEGIQWRAIENIADIDFTVTEQSAIVVERIKFNGKNIFLQNLCTTEYRHLQNFNAEIETEPYLPLSQTLMSL